MKSKFIMLFQAIKEIFFTKEGSAFIPDAKIPTLGEQMNQIKGKSMNIPFGEIPMHLEPRFFCQNCINIVTGMVNFIFEQYPEFYEKMVNGFLRESDIYALSDMVHRGEWNEVIEHYNRHFLTGFIWFFEDLENYEICGEIKTVLDNNKPLTKIK